MSLILLAAFALSVHRLGEESIWVDEGLTLSAARADTWEIFSRQVEADDYNPPLSYLLWHYWILSAGSTEFGARFFSVLAALIASALTYKLGERLFDDPAIGLLSSLLLVSSGFHVSYAQMVRGYSLLEMLTLLSWYCAIKLYYRPGFGPLLIYVLSNVALIYTHYYGAFVLLGQNLFFGAQLARSWQISRLTAWRGIGLKVKNWLAPQVIVAASFAPWMPIMVSRASQSAPPIGRPSWEAVVGPVLEFTWSPAGFVLAMCLLFLGVYVLIRPAVARLRLAAPTGVQPAPLKLPAGAVLLAIWLFSIWAAPLGISYFFKPIFLNRYMIPALPAFYLLLAWIALRVVRPAVGLLLAGLLIAAQLSGLYFLYNSVNNEQWRMAAAYIDSQAGSGDLLLFYSGVGQLSYEYYSQRTDLLKAQLGSSNGPAKAQAAITGIQPAVVWLVLVYRQEIEFGTDMKQLGYTLVDQQDFFRINLFKYRRL